MQCDIIATPKFKTQFTVFLRSEICMHLQPTCEYVTECIPSVLLNNRILIQVGAIIEVNLFLDSEWVSKYQATVSPCLGPDRLEVINFDITEYKIDNHPSCLIIKFFL